LSVWLNYTGHDTLASIIFSFNTTGLTSIIAASIDRFGRCNIRMTAGGVSSSYPLPNGGAGLTNGTWSHIVFCIDVNGNWSFYFDGVNQNIVRMGSIINRAYDSSYINRSPTTISGTFTGNIDVFKIY